MGEYTAELTIYDERNGEIVGILKDIEIEQDAIAEEYLEDMEEFISVSINKYEETDYAV